jgi:hypothetical protein
MSIPGAPDWMAIAPGAVWVSNGDMNNVARVDPKPRQLAGAAQVDLRRGEQRLETAPCSSGSIVATRAFWMP